MEIGSRNVSAAQLGMVATGGLAGGMATSMYTVYKTHGGKFAQFSELARTAVRPGVIGAGVGIAIGAGVALALPDDVDTVMKGTLVGMGAGGLYNIMSGFQKMPAEARSFSRVRLISGPVLLGAGVGAALGMGLGIASTFSSDEK